MLRPERLSTGFHPNRIAKMFSCVVESPQSELDAAILKRATALENAPHIVVVQPAAANHIRGSNGVLSGNYRRSPVEGNVVPFSVLLIIARSCRVVQRGSQVPARPALARVDLMVILAVIVHLIGVVVVVVLATSGYQIFNARRVSAVSVFVRIGSPRPNGIGWRVQSDAGHTVPSLLRPLVAQHRRIGNLTRVPAVSKA